MSGVSLQVDGGLIKNLKGQESDLENLLLLCFSSSPRRYVHQSASEHPRSPFLFILR
jgi:hypothetical protein